MSPSDPALKLKHHDAPKSRQPDARAASVPDAPSYDAAPDDVADSHAHARREPGSMTMFEIFERGKRMNLGPTTTPSACPTATPTMPQCWKLDVPRPPEVSSAAFTDTGAQVLVQLDAESDQGGIDAGVYFDCGTVVDFADVDAAKCYWTNSTQLTMDVNLAASFVSYDEVAVKADTLKLKCQAGARCDCYGFNNAVSYTHLTLPTILRV